MKDISPYRILLLLAVFLIAKGADCQQAWMYNLHQFNIFDVNHAYAGAYDEWAVGMRYRNQWTGVDGAPKTAQFSLHLPLKSSFSTGLVVRSEEIGANRWSQVKGTFAYKLGMKNRSLSFALTPSFWSQKLDLTKISAKDENDEILMAGNPSQSGVSIDFSALYRTPQALIGVQINNLNQPGLTWYNGSVALLRLHADILAEYSFVTTGGHVIKPVTMLRFTPGYSPSADFSLQYFWRETFWFGGGYRLGSTAFVLAEWQINKKFRIGYSYDLFASGQLVSSRGSHEVFLGWNLSKTSSSVPSIRYFK